MTDLDRALAQFYSHSLINLTDVDISRAPQEQRELLTTMVPFAKEAASGKFPLLLPGGFILLGNVMQH